MNDNIFDLLLSTSFTYRQLNRRANLTKSFYEKYIYNNPKPKPQDFFTDPLDWQWFLTYQNPLQQALSNPNVRTTFNDLDHKLKEVKPVTCFTAIQIPEDRLEPLVSSLRQELGSPVVLETRVDPAIIGGCVLIRNGLVKDYSLRNKLANKKTELLGAFEEAIPK